MNIISTNECVAVGPMDLSTDSPHVSQILGKRKRTDHLDANSIPQNAKRKETAQNAKAAPYSFTRFQELDKFFSTYSKTDPSKHSLVPELSELIATYESNPHIAFGDEKWKEHFGDIGKALPLPHDIGSMLASPCPFNLGKKVIETHMLVLVPEKLDGTPMTLKRLGELMKSKGKLGYDDNSYFVGHENTPFEASHWVLMTKDVIESSRNASDQAQKDLVEKHPNYRMLKLSEAVTAIFMEYLVTGVHHFSREPWTYTRCQEKSTYYGQMTVGGFASPPGLNVFFIDLDRASIGVAVARKF